MTQVVVKTSLKYKVLLHWDQHFLYQVVAVAFSALEYRKKKMKKKREAMVFK